ncbi:unnamed protein product [Rodentolepis nana]|uniref:Granulin n=1 Tax=Rodentolepis nana TaxID=102285 RepID=A0A0R3T3L5_RODNA|nr:unnamed protein product [Rodentolepis nana]
MWFLVWLWIIPFDNFALAALECSQLCASGTCCKSTDNKLLCCPFSNGICCASANKCCPSGTQCQSDGFCSKARSGVFSLLNFFAKSSPQQQGVCCEDGKHCCPAEYKCDVATRSCRLSLSSIFKSSRNCPLSDSDCSDDESCCILKDGSKGCCPYPKADCCADGAHCCPEGTVCNSDSSSCIPKRGAWVNPFKSSPKLLGRKSVVCPGGKLACNKGSTCCKSAAGDDSSYSCCPHENAVYCGDGIHRCPEGYKCDLRNGGSCVRASAEITKKSIGGNKCNDGQTVCPDDSTCCSLSDGTYGCCPLPNALCCEDKLHCCPNGYKCDVAHKRCIHTKINWLTVPISKKLVPYTAYGEVKKSDCKPNWTSCSANGRTGCCPLKDAICCSDGLHCCLKGSTCLDNGICLVDIKTHDSHKTYARAARLL